MNAFRGCHRPTCSVTEVVCVTQCGAAVCSACVFTTFQKMAVSALHAKGVGLIPGYSKVSQYKYPDVIHKKYWLQVLM